MLAVLSRMHNTNRYTQHTRTRTCTTQDEQAKRRQAERDFLELMQSIEEGGSNPSSGGTALSSQRLAVMQVCLRACVCLFVNVRVCVCVRKRKKERERQLEVSSNRSLCNLLLCVILQAILEALEEEQTQLEHFCHSSLLI